MKIFRHIKSVVLLLKKYWFSSKKFSVMYRKNRLFFFCDILLSTIKFGADDTDYLMFDFYNKSNEQRDKYITCFRTYRYTKRMNQDVFKKLLSKSWFNKHFKEFLNRDYLLCKNSSVDDINNFIKKFGKVIVKPEDSALGSGVHILQYSDVNEEVLKSLENKNTILEEVLENVPELKKISPSSLNTIRIVTATDKFGNVEFLSSILRMGTGEAVIDNLCTGGIACEIDMETGKLKNNARDINNTSYPKHPNSGVYFDGYVIPHFDKVLLIVKKMCSMMPEARYVGWDIAVTTKGVCVIEGNTPPSEETTEFSSDGQWYKLLNFIKD